MRVDAGIGATCWTVEDGGVKCHGGAPIGDAFVSSYTPASVALPSANLGERVAQVAVGAQARCMLFDGGDVYCWSYNAYGQLGDGSPRIQRSLCRSTVSVTLSP